MQLGVEKGLVILGIRLSAIPPPGQCLQHEDVEPSALFPVKKSNGEVVYQQLEETVKHTGVPRQIIGDQGSDLASGIEKFRQEHRETCYIYDIKHKTAAVLKHVLHEDETWRAFTQLTVQTKHKITANGLRLSCAAKPKDESTLYECRGLDSLGKDMT